MFKNNKNTEKNNNKIPKDLFETINTLPDEISNVCAT